MKYVTKIFYALSTFLLPITLTAMKDTVKWSAPEGSVPAEVSPRASDRTCGSSFSDIAPAAIQDTRHARVVAPRASSCLYTSSFPGITPSSGGPDRCQSAPPSSSAPCHTAQETKPCDSHETLYVGCDGKARRIAKNAMSVVKLVPRRSGSSSRAKSPSLATQPLPAATITVDSPDLLQTGPQDQQIGNALQTGTDLSVINEETDDEGQGRTTSRCSICRLFTALMLLFVAGQIWSNVQSDFAK